MNNDHDRLTAEKVAAQRRDTRHERIALGFFLSLIVGAIIAVNWPEEKTPLPPLPLMPAISLTSKTLSAMTTEDYNLSDRIARKWVQQAGHNPDDAVLRESVMSLVNLGVDQWREVALDVVMARFSRTLDGKGSVITLTASDGREASLWLNHDGTVRSISPY